MSYLKDEALDPALKLCWVVIPVFLPHGPRSRNGRPDEPIVIQLTLTRRLQKRLVGRLFLILPCEGAVELHRREAQCIDKGIGVVVVGEPSDLAPVRFPEERYVRLSQVVGSGECGQAF